MKDDFLNWLKQHYPKLQNLNPLAGDASFRQFYRFEQNGQRFVAIDSSHVDENPFAFSSLAKILKEKGLHVPEVEVENLALGYLVVSDLGDGLYQAILNEENADTLYRLAIDALVVFQTRMDEEKSRLPLFDETVWMNELKLFEEWFLKAYLKINFSPVMEKFWDDNRLLLCQEIKKQPMVAAHRDYHSRNLLLSEKKVGIVDFQDACLAPFTYDLVSLLRDCYIQWPEEKIKAWLKDYNQKIQGTSFAPSSFNQLLDDFNWMGIQRHLKAIFIFARKYCRDQNPDYLKFIPRALHYVLNISEQYPSLIPMRDWLLRYVLEEVQDLS